MNTNQHLRTGFIIHKGNRSAVKRIKFINDRTSYITLRGRCCDIIVLNVHTQTENKSDDTKDSHYEETGHAFDQIPK